MMNGSEQVLADGAPSLVWRTRTPAPEWGDGLIVGSGRVGALVFGPLEALMVSVAHERFFLPANPHPPAPLIAPSLDSLREAVRAGDGEHAGELLADAARASGFADDLIWTDPLAICATLQLRGASGTLRHRVMDLPHGEARIEWDDYTGGRCSLSVLAPRSSEGVWLRLASERDLHLELELGLSDQRDEASPTGAPSYSDAVRSTAIGGDRGQIVVSSYGATERSVRAATTLRGPAPWREQPGVTTLTSRLHSGPESPGMLHVVVDVRAQDGNGSADGEPAGNEDPSWETLRVQQASTHGELVRRSLLNLGTGPGPETVEELWLSARNGDATARRRAVEVAYVSGRANAISATGELPPTLQGVWQGTWSPAWSADFTMNGNVQNGGAACLIPTGTPELARSLLRLVLPHLEDFRENARRVYGARGMLLPARMSNHGRANHFGRPFPHIFWIGGGGWVLRFAADIVATTGDRSVVDDQLWELVHGVLEFAETATVTMADGRRHLIPSYSPENSPIPGGSPIIADATVDVAILRDAARCTRLLGGARGDHSLDERWARVLAELPPYRIAEDGSLAEWIGDLWPENHAHRHASQLYPLWYEPDEAFIGASQDAARLRAAAARTVSAKLDWRAQDPVAPPGRMEMAFGLVQLGMASAALGDGEGALVCAEWLALEHWTPSLTTTHDAGSIFNLDPSGGLPALVAAMLLGSGSQSLSVLPALPAAWATEGSVTGLRARGGIIVDRLEWDEEGGSITLRRPTRAAWLAPEGSTQVQIGAPFQIADATIAEDGIAAEDTPVTIHFIRADVPRALSRPARG